MRGGGRVAGVTLEQVRGTYKKRDSWWTVLLVDPLAGRLVRLFVGQRWITPTRLTVAAFLLGLGAAAAFLQADPAWLVAGAVLYYVSFTVDCVDGKIARLRGDGTVLGSWLDFLLDRLRVFLAVLALFGGQYVATGNDLFLFTAVAVVFLALIGYLNGAEIDQIRRRMARSDTGAAAHGDAGGAAMPSGLARIRSALHRRRIRMNLVSGVEFEMALFVVAPLVAAVAGPEAIFAVVAVAAALLIVFEAALMARFVKTARSHDRRVRAGRPPVPRAATLVRTDDRARHVAG
jgi:phosphatidylglycerophosphate synthase